MKIYKKIFITLLIIFIFILSILIFKNQIFTFIWIKKYEHKYQSITSIEKNLSFDKTQNLVEENEITIKDFQTTLSNLKYSKDEKKLEFNLKFKNQNILNNVGYVLRVYNPQYCLGDNFIGYISLDSSIEYIISYNKFYEENFGYKNQSINLNNNTFSKNDLKNTCNMIEQTEILENGELLHQISFDLPKEFTINDILKIELFDLNYQNVGDTTIYKVQEPLTQIQYTINLN